MNTLLIALIAGIPPTILAIATLIATLRNTSKLQSVHLELNGRLSQLLEASVAQGRQDEREDPKP